jgi:hypothetical protein
MRDLTAQAITAVNSTGEIEIVEIAGTKEVLSADYGD